MIVRLRCGHINSTCLEVCSSVAMSNCRFDKSTHQLHCDAVPEVYDATLATQSLALEVQALRAEMEGLRAGAARQAALGRLAHTRHLLDLLSSLNMVKEMAKLTQVAGAALADLDVKGADGERLEQGRREAGNFVSSHAKAMQQFMQQTVDGIAAMLVESAPAVRRTMAEHELTDAVVAAGLREVLQAMGRDDQDEGGAEGAEAAKEEEDEDEGDKSGAGEAGAQAQGGASDSEEQGGADAAATAAASQAVVPTPAAAPVAPAEEPATPAGRLTPVGDMGEWWAALPREEPARQLRRFNRDNPPPVCHGILVPEADPGEEGAGRSHWIDPKIDLPLITNGLVLKADVLEARRARLADESALRAHGVRFATRMPQPPRDDQTFRRQEAVRRAFRHAWRGYERHAWGADDLLPVSKRGSAGLCKMGLTIVDSLDTMLIMGLPKEYMKARAWVEGSLRFGTQAQKDLNLFETTIRILGGLLSAFELAGDELYLRKATQLATLMLPAFDSPTGIPYGTMGLRRGKFHNPSWQGGASSLSEVGTLQVEFSHLARRTGRREFERAALRAMEAVIALTPPEGLFPIAVHPDKGQLVSGRVTLGARGDSFYEYLLKQYLQWHPTAGRMGRRRRRRLLDLYHTSLRGVLDRLLMPSQPSSMPMLGELTGPLSGRGGAAPAGGEAGRLLAGAGAGSAPRHERKMDHLVCFVPGMLALGARFGHGFNASWVPGMQEAWPAGPGESIASGASEGAISSGFFAGVSSPPSGLRRVMGAAEGLLETCFEMYNRTSTGLAPEIAFFPTAPGSPDLHPKGGARHSLLRPETVESLFIMWRLTKDPKYREWGWQIFNAIERHARLPWGGYSGWKDSDFGVGDDPKPPSTAKSKQKKQEPTDAEKGASAGDVDESSSGSGYPQPPAEVVRQHGAARPGQPDAGCAAAMDDKMESFFLAETLKYLYLLFSEDDMLPLDEWVFNTEAHPLPLLHDHDGDDGGERLTAEDHRRMHAATRLQAQGKEEEEEEDGDEPDDDLAFLDSL